MEIVKDDRYKMNGNYEGVPQHLKEFLADDEKLKSFSPELLKIDKETLLYFATECVHVNNKHYNHIFKNCCNICDKQLTEFELSLIKSTDISIVCKEHRSSAVCFNVDLERKRLKYPPRNLV